MSQHQADRGHHRRTLRCRVQTYSVQHILVYTRNSKALNGILKRVQLWWPPVHARPNSIHWHTNMCHLQSYYSQQPSTQSPVPTANSQQPTANSPVPTANSQQPTANSQQPTAIEQPPATKRQQSTHWHGSHSARQQSTTRANLQQPIANSQQQKTHSHQTTTNSQHHSLNNSHRLHCSVP